MFVAQNAFSSSNISIFKPLNAELNPICHFLALLGAHHILHVSRVRVKADIPLCDPVIGI